jgi:S1-C subfamily serine protease
LLLVELQRGGPLDAVGAVGAREEAIVGNQRMFVGGDILTAVNGQPIAGPEELQILLESNYKVGDSVTVTLLRQGQEMTMETALTEEPARQ